MGINVTQFIQRLFNVWLHLKTPRPATTTGGKKVFFFHAMRFEAVRLLLFHSSPTITIMFVQFRSRSRRRRIFRRDGNYVRKVNDEWYYHSQLAEKQKHMLSIRIRKKEEFICLLHEIPFLLCRWRRDVGCSSRDWELISSWKWKNWTTLFRCGGL